MKSAAIAAGAGIVAFWLIMNGFLLRRVLEYRGLDEYRRGVIDYLGESVRRERQMGIFRMEPRRRIGHSRFAIERTAGPDSSGYFIEYSTLADLDVLGLGGSLAIEGEADLDAGMVPKTLRADVRAGPLRFRIEGRREEDRIVVAVKDGDRRLFRQSLPLENLLLGDGLVPPLPVGGLEVGRTYRVPVFDPVFKEKDVADSTVTGEGQQSVDGVPVDCLVIETRFRGKSFRSYVTRDGEVIRQEIPDLIPGLDIYLQRETPQKSGVHPVHGPEEKR